MTALILAAGRGERMRHLTDDCPKPLLDLNGKTLIEHRIEALRQAGIHNIIINLFYLGQLIVDTLQDGHHLGVNITYSYEHDVLDVGGGIIQACHYTDDSPLIVTTADIDTDFDYSQLTLPQGSHAHLVLTDNPEHHRQGDFYLHSNGLLDSHGDTKLTYTGISIIDPSYFKTMPIQKTKFTHLINPLIQTNTATGEYYAGHWLNMDTPERLQLASEHHHCQ